MTPDKTEHMSARLSELADDFFCNIILIKHLDFQNRSIPFLHGHALELSVKAACHKLNVDFSSVKNGHNILGIYELLKVSLPGITPFIPSASSLVKYKEIWLPGDSSKNLVGLPSPQDLNELELAYIMDNVVNLKYGFRKDYNQVSQIDICYETLNPNFVSLFKLCRQVYATEKLNTMFKGKIYKMFGQSSVIDKNIKDLLDI